MQEATPKQTNTSQSHLLIAKPKVFIVLQNKRINFAFSPLSEVTVEYEMIRHDKRIFAEIKIHNIRF